MMASVSENYIGNVRNLIAAETYAELAEHLKENHDLLTKNWHMLDNLVDSLDLQNHTISIVHLLAAKFECATTTNTDAEQLMDLMEGFLENCSQSDLQCALSAYYEMCHCFTKYVVDTPYCMKSIQILATAINKVGVHESRLTPVHSDLCQLSLKAYYFDVALEYLNVDMTEISTGAEMRQGNADPNNDSKYFLLYYYYGGMIYTVVKDYERALYFYDLCLSTPAMTMSHIMLEAYKKFILVSLLHRGRVVPLSKNASQILTRSMKPAALVYQDLVNAYASSSSEEMQNVINKYSETYKRDNNRGLVKQVAQSLYKNNIRRLTKTFLTLSLEDVAEKVQLPNAAEAEKYILMMIKSREIFATINRKDGMVIFHDSPQKYNSAEMFLNVQNCMTHAAEWIKKFNVMTEEIMLNPTYIKKMAGNQEDDSSSAKSLNEPTD